MDDPEILPVIVPVEVPISIAETEDEIDLVSEQVGLLSIEGEERADQIMEGIEACRERLDNLSASTMQPESPMLNQIVTDLSEIKAQLALLLSEPQNRRESSNTNTSNLPPSDSMNPESHEEPELVESTDEVNRPAPRVKRYRVI